MSKSVLSTFLDPEAARPGSSKVTITLGLVVHAAGKKNTVNETTLVALS